ncbi:uncharacterized protein LOC132727145 isoform X2 [Ruditapes philippinarum]|uniref:uncharacterized protein LOC132727145 isoform X2 n=1 Tax=Ruditapes philippinarum TaxID=129788 RepID=UPI00295AB7EC|nr:uncharacterized protein LOC132727145 isoform X2 [Ruditapes philippinarum]
MTSKVIPEAHCETTHVNLEVLFTIIIDRLHVFSLRKMAEELEELESLLSEHFGRTPFTTPCNTQEDVSSDSGSDQDIRENSIVESRVRDFLYQDRGASTGANGCSEDIERDEELEWSDEDEVCDDYVEPDSDRQQVELYKSSKCCRLACSGKFTKDQIYQYLLNMKEMEKETKEIYIMGLINDERSTEKTQRGKKRQRMRRKYTFHGTEVCKKTFLLCHGIGKKTLSSLSKQVFQEGIAPRIHGNTGRKPHNAITFDDVTRVIHFISNFADERGIHQPAAPRGRDDIPPIYLPSETTKVQMHKDYCISCTEAVPQIKHVSLSMFKTLWSTCMPHIRIATPRDDVCATCERMRKMISDAVSEEDKLEALANMRQHILLAQRERDTYNTCLRRSADEDEYFHFTFDFCQNVSLPHHARQMGPLYFLTLRKVQIFGFRIDGIPKQLNFLIDENETVGEDGSKTHGPDAVISMVDWALQEHCVRARKFSIHADNCPGQNKNKYVLAYFMWRVMTGQNEVIEYLMQIPGNISTSGLLQTNQVLLPCEFHLMIKMRKRFVF